MRRDITFGGVFPDYPLADRPDTVGKLSGWPLTQAMAHRPVLVSRWWIDVQRLGLPF